jgi:hypothetical protein
MRVLAALIARDVEHATQAAIRGHHRGGRAGQEAVAIQIMLGAVDHHRGLFGQGGANGVGATVLFQPECARAQGHPLGALQKIRITLGVQQHALRVREDDHAARIAHLIKHKLHHGAGLGHKIVFTGQCPAQLSGGANRGGDRWVGGGDPGLLAAQPGARKGVIHQALRHLTGFKQAPASLAQVVERGVVRQLHRGPSILSGWNGGTAAGVPRLHTLK